MTKRQTRIVFVLAIVQAVLGVLLFTMVGCVAQKAPQTSLDKGDTRPISIDAKLQLCGPTTTQPADATGYTWHIENSAIILAVTVNATSAGTTEKTETMTGQQPGPATVSPNVSPNIPINLTPGAGGLKLGQ